LFKLFGLIEHPRSHAEIDTQLTGTQLYDEVAG